jgi:hypothetical protein
VRYLGALYFVRLNEQPSLVLGESTLDSHVIVFSVTKPILTSNRTMMR